MQPVPEGYEPLNFVGFTDRGTYSDSMTYIKNDITHKDNTAWRCLIDDTVGIIPSPDNEHWEVFVAATNDSSGITTTDILGILGNEGEKVSNQDLIDAIADRVINKLVEKAQMSGVQVNDENRIPTSALLYSMNNEINESLDELNENLSKAITVDNIGSQHVSSAISAQSANSVAWDNVYSKPSAYTPVAHTHDNRYYTEDEIASLLSGKAASNHNHDNRYYTETEINNIMEWTKIGDFIGNKTLSVSGFDSKKEFMVAWRGDGTGNPWKYIIFKRDKAQIIDSYYYSSTYYGCICFAIESGNTFKLFPAWCSIKQGEKTLSVDSMEVYLYAR